MFLQFGCVCTYHSVAVYLTSWVSGLKDSLGQMERETSGQHEPQWSRLKYFVQLSILILMGSSAADSRGCWSWVCTLINYRTLRTYLPGVLPQLAQAQGGGCAPVRRLMHLNLAAGRADV